MVKELFKKLFPLIVALAFVMTLNMLDGVHGIFLAEEMTEAVIVAWAVLLSWCTVPVVAFQRRLITKRWILYESLYTAALVTFSFGYYFDSILWLKTTALVASAFLLVGAYAIWYYCLANDKLYTSFDTASRQHHIWLRDVLLPNIQTISREEVKRYFETKTFFFLKRNTLKAGFDVRSTIDHEGRVCSLAELIAAAPGEQRTTELSVRMEKQIDDLWREILQKRKEADEKAQKRIEKEASK